MDNIKMEYWTASWCSPCRAVHPIVEQLKADGWDIEKIDVDQNRARAQERRIAAVPTFIVTKNGQVVNRLTGARDKATLLQLLNS